jgi:hypothetical protein
MSYFKDLVTGHPAWSVAVGAVVFLLLVALIIWALKEGREISFWPPKIGPRQLVTPQPELASRKDNSAVKVSSKEAKASEWYTEWRFGSVIHQEPLRLLESDDGTVTGLRLTQSHKGVMEYAVVGYTKGGWYWLEYHDPALLGGGTLQLHAFTSGRLRGVVTYPDCRSGRHQCVANQWLLKGSVEAYDEAWRTKLAETY